MADATKPDAAKARASEQRRWRQTAGLVVSLLLLGICGVGYTTYVDGKRAETERQNDQRWCELLVQLDNAYAESPPPTELGREVAKSIHDLRVSLDC